MSPGAVNPGSWTSRLAALALLLALPLAAALLLTGPLLRSHAALDAEIAQLQDRIARFERLISAREQLSRAGADLEARLAAESGLLPVTGEALAAAELQQLLDRLLREQGGRLESVQARPVEAVAGTEGALRSIAIRVQLVAPLAGIVGLMAEIEGHRPYLFLDALSLAPLDRRSRYDDWGFDEMVLRADLFALARSEPEAP